MQVFIATAIRILTHYMIVYADIYIYTYIYNVQYFLSILKQYPSLFSLINNSTFL